MNLDHKVDAAKAECSAFGGDFHWDDDDVHRGTVLAAAGVDGFAGASAFEDPFCSKEESPFGAEDRTMFPSGECALVKFDAGITPPASPSDPFFQFESTTIFVKVGLSPSEIGNGLLSLFSSEKNASVTKVSPQKCTMKVHIDSQGFVCELKVRLYQHLQGHAVEFQRQAGEVFVFTAIYTRAADHLQVLAASSAGTRPGDQFKSLASDAPLPSSLACTGEPYCEPTELVMLPLLMLQQDERLLSAFPRESLADFGIPPCDGLGSRAVPGHSYWGPLALPQPAMAA